jgi:hypothetical protein
VEFMDKNFLRNYAPDIYKAGVPPGNLDNFTWSSFEKAGSVIAVPCLPLDSLLRRAGVSHVNFFILDVEVLFLNCIKGAVPLAGFMCREASSLC